jgi:hypothetical protein
LHRTTQGWHLLVHWHDGTTSWEPLQNLKESNPVEIAEYAIANKLVEEVAFHWWVPLSLRKRDRIIANVKVHACKHNQKLRIEILHYVERALMIDSETNINFWKAAIEKKMKHVMCTFNMLDKDAEEPKMSKQIPCHMIFNVKMDFTRKACFVAGGHVTEPPTSITYLSLVAWDSVRLAFLIAVLNDLNILGGEIRNAYLHAETKERVHMVCGPKFEHQSQGHFAIICWALYGLKSSGAAWRSAFVGTLYNLGFTSSLADPDIQDERRQFNENETILGWSNQRISYTLPYCLLIPQRSIMQFGD